MDSWNSSSIVSHRSDIYSKWWENSVRLLTQFGIFLCTSLRVQFQHVVPAIYLCILYGGPQISVSMVQLQNMCIHSSWPLPFQLSAILGCMVPLLTSLHFSSKWYCGSYFIELLSTSYPLYAEIRNPLYNNEYAFTSPKKNVICCTPFLCSCSMVEACVFLFSNTQESYVPLY